MKFIDTPRDRWVCTEPSGLNLAAAFQADAVTAINQPVLRIDYRAQTALQGLALMALNLTRQLVGRFDDFRKRGVVSARLILGHNLVTNSFFFSLEHFPHLTGARLW